MAAPHDDIFASIRNAVGQTLEMAEADAKLSEEKKTLLSHLILTRRGDGEIVLDVAALQRMKAADNQWVDKGRKEQDRFVNPTRLPQLVSGLQGLQAGQYLAYVQRPLDRRGENAPFLEAAALRLYDQYHPRELAQERNKLFGQHQRHVAKLLLNALLSKQTGTTDATELDKLRAEMPPQQQFELAAKELDISTTEVMNRLFKYGVALTLIDRIKAKALRIKKSKDQFEGILRKLAQSDIGPTAKTRIKEIFLGFQKELDQMGVEMGKLTSFLGPIIACMHKDSFDEHFTKLHRHAAQLDALASRWTIILTEANNKDKMRTDVDKVKGMHKVFTE